MRLSSIDKHSNYSSLPPSLLPPPTTELHPLLQRQLTVRATSPLLHLLHHPNHLPLHLPRQRPSLPPLPLLPLTHAHRYPARSHPQPLPPLHLLSAVPGRRRRRWREELAAKERLHKLSHLPSGPRRGRLRPLLSHLHRLGHARLTFDPSLYRRCAVAVRRERYGCRSGGRAKEHDTTPDHFARDQSHR